MVAARRARLPVPLVYLAGAPGGASTRSRAQLAAAGVEVEAIGPAGHWPFIDDHDSVARVLVPFLRAQLG